ncbi:VOC family protein [Pseudonocardia sp. TRM90224]|uniref:VOC family protein n=1 Tax=Pseudonocardia sp. TRM90224 TaxID=2812678 RepID=UPI001E53AA34|nr:VOC family protein [Pseudonocardia sp. TRM90224]
MPNLSLTAAVLDAPDARELAGFYRRLFPDWEVVQDDPDWVTLRPAGGGAGLSFQSEEFYVPPVWPSTRERPQMMVHLDIEVDDLEAAIEHAVAAGATVSHFQPQEHVRVLLDPAGHPFCLYLP